MDILIESSIFAAFIVLLYKLIYPQALKIKRACAVSDAVDSSETTGYIIFDSNGDLEFTNKMVKSVIPLFLPKLKKPKLADFLEYIRIHLDTMDEALRAAVLQMDATAHKFDFTEFASFEEGKIFLIKMNRNVKGGRTLFIINDVTPNKLREKTFQRINEKNYQLTQAISASTCGIIVSDPKSPGNPVIFVNKAASEFLACTKPEIIAGSWEVILNALSEQEVRETMLLATLNAEAAELEARLERDEEIYWFALKFNPVVDEGGNLDLYICVFTDISLLKKRENEARQSQKLEALGQLAAGIAHDFNNVLSIVDGYAEMAEKIIEQDPENVHLYLKKIKGAAKRGAGLTQKMLTFSRHKVISGNIINLRDALMENKAFLSPLLGETIKFEMILPEEELCIRASADAFSHVLVNLCVNARDSMPGGGFLIVNASRSEPSQIPDKIHKKINSADIVQILVGDTGMGMDKKIQERIFDPFFTTKPQGKGTGLGLSVVYGLVKEMGGAIDVQSMPGRGTNISIYLPISSEPMSKTMAVDLEDEAHICLKGYTVLVVEDEPDLLHAVCAILEGFELTVISAQCGDEALVIQDQMEGEINFLLTDVVMPGMSGVKLADLMSSLRPEMHTIFMSGYPAHGDMAPVEIPKEAIFIAKPVDYRELAILLTKILEYKKLSNLKIEYTEIMQQWVTSKNGA